MNKGIKSSLIIFLTSVIVILAGFFLLDFERSAINVSALCFLEFSLLVSMLGTISLASRKNNKDTLYYNAGIGSITAIYQIAVIISVAVSSIFKENIKGFIFLQIVINALMFVVCTLIAAASAYVSKSNKKALEKSDNNEYYKAKRGGF